MTLQLAALWALIQRLLIMDINNRTAAFPCCDYGERNFRICDFHSHILPDMDDGADNTKTALSMLAESRRQGIDAIIATPHFYADRETPESFMERRKKAVSELLSGGYDPNLHPTVYLGAEVAYFAGMSNSAGLPDFCVDGTRCILIEMPFSRWNDTVINEIIAVRDALGLRPVIAHIERYISYQHRASLGRLIDGGALIQSNAEFFIDKKTRKKALKLLLRGGIHLIGTDTHGLSERAPNMGEALDIICNHKLGAELMGDIGECTEFVLKKAIPLSAEAKVEA